MAHAVRRGANSRQHEVDFEGADAAVEISFGDEAAVEAPDDPAPSGGGALLC